MDIYQGYLKVTRKRLDLFGSITYDMRRYLWLDIVIEFVLKYKYLHIPLPLAFSLLY